MSITRAVTIEDSKHQVVWSYDDDVERAPYAGWCPRAECRGVRSGATVLQVRGLNAGELAALRDAVGSSFRAGCLSAAYTAVAKKDRATVDAIYAYDEGIITALWRYIEAISTGLDPAEHAAPAIRQVYGAHNGEEGAPTGASKSG